MLFVEDGRSDFLGQFRGYFAARRAGRLCVPVHNYIYSPAIQRAKQLIDQGKLGKLSSLWMLYNQKHPADVADGRPELLLRDDSGSTGAPPPRATVRITPSPRERIRPFSPPGRRRCRRTGNRVCRGRG